MKWSITQQKEDIGMILRTELDAELMDGVSIEVIEASDRLVHDRIGYPKDEHDYYDVEVKGDCKIFGQPAYVYMHVLTDVRKNELCTYQVLNSSVR